MGFNYPASLSVFNKQPANPADGCHAEGLFGERASPACVYWGFQDQGTGGVQSGDLSSSPWYKSCCLPTMEQY